MKRQSLKMDEGNWNNLNELALVTRSLYRGKPSWRRLISRIAKGELHLNVVGGFSGGKHERRAVQVDKRQAKVATFFTGRKTKRLPGVVSKSPPGASRVSVQFADVGPFGSSSPERRYLNSSQLEQVLNRK